MAKTYTLSVDASDPYEQIVVQSPFGCRKVIIYENAQAGTTDYRVKAPTSSDAAVTRPAGAKTELLPTNGALSFSNGEVVGHVQTVSGTITFAQEEA
jgi:hypothetical protein